MEKFYEFYHLSEITCPYSVGSDTFLDNKESVIEELYVSKYHLEDFRH